MSEIRTLREWRIVRGLGQRELARLAGVSATTISDLERGGHHGRPRSWRLIAQALGVDILQIAEYRRAMGLDADGGTAEPREHVTG